MLDLAVSTCFIFFSCWLSYWCRKLIPRAFPDKPFVQALFLEAIATWDLCAACYELIIVADNYGVGTYAVYLFLLTIWWSQTWGNATACPYTHLEDVANGMTSITRAFALIAAQVISAIFVFRYTRFIWSMELSPAYLGRAYEQCTADLQVPAIFGAIIECCATCLCRICSRAIGEVQPKFATALDAFVGTSLVVAAFNYSGGYFNPVLATSLKFNCKGNTTFEHVLVYWIGACVGSLAAIPLYEYPFIKEQVDKFKLKAE